MTSAANITTHGNNLTTRAYVSLEAEKIISRWENITIVGEMEGYGQYRRFRFKPYLRRIRKPEKENA